jgi:threonine dehydrogenase-like Zn-dependent dehydrogenase
MTPISRRSRNGSVTRISRRRASTTSGAEIAKLTSGRGVDLVSDATYSEEGFVEAAKTVRRGGSWIVLGVGPGKTTRLV